MKKTWVLVADASRAQLYSHSRGGALELFMEFDHPESRMKGSDIKSDRAGYQNSKGTGHGSMEARPPKQHEAEVFARELAATIEKGRTSNTIENLIVTAPPHFAGLLNRSLSDKCRQLIRASIEKDYTRLAPQALYARLEPQLNF